MKNICSLFCILFSLSVYSQSFSADYSIYTKSVGKKADATTKSAISPFEFCDADSDGIMALNIDEIKNRVLDSSPLQIIDESGIYIGTSAGTIQLVKNLTTNPTIETVCSNLPVPLFDIAYDKNGDTYGCYGYKIFKINTANCTVEAEYSFDVLKGINSLSFDRQSSMYFGGSSSKVYRLDSGSYNQTYIWHDFGQGQPGGDFVMYGDKMYVAWNLNETYLLYEVIVDFNMNYISHRVLGDLPFPTYGLASELGSLYAVTPTKLFRIKINSNSISNELILQGGNTGAWFGAAGKNEAVAFDIKAYETATDAQSQVNSLPSIWNNTIPGGQTIYVAIKNLSNQQSQIVPVKIKIDVAPSYTKPKNIERCALDVNAFVFDLNQSVSEIIGSQTNLTVSFHESEIDATNNSNPIQGLYTINGKFKKVYFRVASSLSSCFSISSFDLIINETPIYIQPKDLSICDMFPLKFNLRAVELEVVGNQSNLEVTFYESEVDAINSSNSLPILSTFNNNPNYIYFRVTNKLTGCFAVSKFGVSMDLKTNFSDPKDIVICQNKDLKYKLNNFDTTINEILNGQKNDFAGFYKSYNDALNKMNEIIFPYQVEKNDNEIFFRIENSSINSCFEVGSFFVYLKAENQNSNIPFTVKTSGWKSVGNDIEILASGNYEYSLDGLTYQDVPIFKNLLAGEYQIFIRDKDSCSITSDEVFLMMYRNFFTPNGDGINDFWNIIASSGAANVEIVIYDRYGKLIKNMKGDSKGWDGNYNNNPMPSSDYWFELTTEKGKKLKGHFSLKR